MSLLNFLSGIFQKTNQNLNQNFAEEDFAFLVQNIKTLKDFWLSKKQLSVAMRSHIFNLADRLEITAYKLVNRLLDRLDNYSQEELETLKTKLYNEVREYYYDH